VVGSRHRGAWGEILDLQLLKWGVSIRHSVGRTSATAGSRQLHNLPGGLVLWWRSKNHIPVVLDSNPCRDTEVFVVFLSLPRHIPEYTSITSRLCPSKSFLRGELISLWLYKENKLRDWKNVFTLDIPLWAPHTYGFVVLTSLTHPSKILLVVLQIGKTKDLSAPLRNSSFIYHPFDAM
jgi:hypothetical protein